MITVGSVRAYDVQETAALLQVTAVTIRSYIHQGKLKAQKIGTKYFIYEKTLKNFIKGKYES